MDSWLVGVVGFLGLLSALMVTLPSVRFLVTGDRAADCADDSDLIEEVPTVGALTEGLLIAGLLIGALIEGLLTLGLLIGGLLDGSCFAGIVDLATCLLPPGA